MRNRWSVRQMMLVLGVLAGLSAMDAFAAQYQPAQIGQHADSLANRIQFPDVPGDYTRFVRCEAKVLAGGSIEEIGCYGDNKVEDEFFFAVHSAAQGASVVPATVDGDNVSLLMLFSVVFRQQGEQRVMVVIPNHGTNAAQFGTDYIAPQRYGRSNVYKPRGEIGLLWIDGQMSAAGTLSDAKFLETQWTKREDKRYARSYAKDCMFIPGFVNGKPVAMRFVKPVFGYRNGFMWEGQDASRCSSSITACDETSRRTGKPRYVFED